MLAVSVAELKYKQCSFGSVEAVIPTEPKKAKLVLSKTLKENSLSFPSHLV